MRNYPCLGAVWNGPIALDANIGPSSVERDRALLPHFGLTRCYVRPTTIEGIIAVRFSECPRVSASTSIEPILVDMAWLGREQGITIQQSVVISPWWSSYDPFPHAWSKESGFKGSFTEDPGWFARKKLAKHFGVSIRELGRITSVVKENWNSLQYLMVIALKHDAYGWFGGFASMGRMDPNSKSKRFGNEASLGANAAKKKYTSAGMQERVAKVGSGGTLAGGATQFYIPNVRMMNVATWSVEDLSSL